MRAVRIRRENVVSGVHRPYIALRKIGSRRALRACKMRRCIKNLLAVGIEEAASRAPLARRDHVLVAAVDVHDEDLVALYVAMRRLEDEFLAIGGEVSLGILSAKR